MKGTSLTEKMILYFLAIGIGGIVITGLFSFYSAGEALLARSYNQLTSIRITRKSAVERFFSDRLHETSFLAASGKYDISMLPSSEYYSGSLIFDSGRIPDSVGNSTRMMQDGMNLMTVAPVPGSSSCLALIIKQDVIDSMMLEVSPEHGLGHSGETYLAGRDYLMRSSSRFINNSVMHTSVYTLPAYYAISGRQGEMLAYDYRGIKVLSSYGQIRVPGLNWIILAEIDYDEAMASVINIRNNIIVISLLTAIALFILTYIISKNITRPLKKLTQAASRLGSGDTGLPLPIESDDEIGELTEAFNLMAIGLQAKEEALKAERIMKVSSTIDGQDKERQRLSRELHDGIGQTIIGIRLRLAAIENEIPKKLKEGFDSLIRINDDLVDEVRAVSNALMPPALAEFGLLSAVRSIGNTINDTLGTDVIVEGEFPENLLGRKPVLYLFRIIQEALNNAARHSGASCIRVSINVRDGMLFLEVSDNGKGFDPAEIIAGHGLMNIRERITILKGKISIESAPGKGTSLKAEIPVNKIQYDKIVAG